MHLHDWHNPVTEPILSPFPTSANWMYHRTAIGANKRSVRSERKLVWSITMSLCLRRRSVRVAVAKHLLQFFWTKKNRCWKCRAIVWVSVMSLCHLNNRYAIVPLVTYSLIYRNPNRSNRYKTLFGSSCSDIVATYGKFLERYGRNTRSQMWETGLTNLIATNINWVNL